MLACISQTLPGLQLSNKFISRIFYILLQILIEVFFVEEKVEVGSKTPWRRIRSGEICGDREGGANILQYLSRQTKKQRIAVS